MKLHELRDNPGARKARKRVGRGIGSGTGKTAGRGVKGQKSRSGVAIKGFEGGQMPIHMRLPKRGFNPLRRRVFSVLNLDDLQKAVEAKKLKDGQNVNAETLVETGVIRRVRDGVRLLGRGELTAKLNLTVDHASATAKAAIEKAGGTVTVTAAKDEAEGEAA